MKKLIKKKKATAKKKASFKKKTLCNYNVSADLITLAYEEFNVGEGKKAVANIIEAFKNEHMKSLANAMEMMNEDEEDFNNGEYDEEMEDSIEDEMEESMEDYLEEGEYDMEESEEEEEEEEDEMDMDKDDMEIEESEEEEEEEEEMDEEEMMEEESKVIAMCNRLRLQGKRSRKSKATK